MIMKKMRIYEPALCCETGLCGVNIDPELLRISAVLNSLRQKGVVIERYNLNSVPLEFIKSNTVNQYVNEKGVEGLPVTTIDEEIAISGRYPTNEEILELLELPAEILSADDDAACCGSGSEDGSCCCDDEVDTCCGEEETESCCCSEEAESCCGATEENKNDGSDQGCCCGTCC